MSTLLEYAFQEAQKLPDYLQDELAQQLLNDIENELKWQAILAKDDLDMGGFEAMAQAALAKRNEIFVNLQRVTLDAGEQ